MNYHLGKICATLVGLFFLVLICLPAHALNITPSRIEKDVDAGQVSSGTFQVFNSAAETYQVGVKVDKYSFSTANLPSCVSWITLNSSKLNIGPLETANIDYSISVPVGAKGEYFAELVFSSGPLTPVGQKEVDSGGYKLNVALNIIQRTPLYVKIKGTEEVSVRITDFAAEWDWFTSSNRFYVFIKNQGNVRVPLKKGEIIIKDEQGVEVARYSFSSKAPLFPKEEKEFSVTSKEVLSAGGYSALTIVDVGVEEPVQTEKKFTVDEQGEISLN